METRLDIVDVSHFMISRRGEAVRHVDREASHAGTVDVWTGDVNIHSRFDRYDVLASIIDDDGRSCKAILA